MRKLLLLPLAACAGVALLGTAHMPQAAAQEPAVASTVRQAANYWTAGRLMRATPLDVPGAAQALEELLAAPADGG